MKSTGILALKKGKIYEVVNYDEEENSPYEVIDEEGDEHLFGKKFVREILGIKEGGVLL